MYGDTLTLVGRGADHRDAEKVLLSAGWVSCGAGDWAVALRSPDGGAVARISPFDPAGPYCAALYREAALTRQVPELFGHVRLAGGGDLQVMEWLRPVPEQEAVAFHQAIVRGDVAVAELAEVVRRVLERARGEAPWCRIKVDDNPDNIMRTADGRLVAADLLGVDGASLYAEVVADPDSVVARIPEVERRFMTEIPLTSTGSWAPEVREAMRAGLATADARRSTPGR